MAFLPFLFFFYKFSWQSYQEAKPVESPPQPKFVIKHRNKNDTQTLKAPSSPQSLHQSLPKKIQLIDQNGDHIELITEEAHDGEYDTDDTEEDHEFTVIVEDTDQVGWSADCLNKSWKQNLKKVSRI